ncbi:MAG TPA: oligosaccharide flippase family protein, partial [Chloroflexota bacterium]|nr:oligosaccharide flippase family protein [Chloroflexota bacterium]
MDKTDRVPLTAGQSPPEAAPIGRVLKNVASNYAGKGIELVTFLLLTPFLLHVLGPVQFGLWSLTGSLVAYGGLLDFGVSNAVTKQVAEYMALDRLTEVRRMLATSLWLYCAVGLLILLLSGALAMLLPLFVALPPGTRREAPWLVVALGATLALSFPGTSAFAALQGLHRYDVATAIRTAWTVISAVAAVAALQFSQSALAVALSNLPVAVAFQLTVFGILHRLSPELRFDPRQAQRKLLRPIASFSSAVFVSNAAFRLETKTDEVVIGSLLGVASVTPYAVAQKLAGLAELLTEQFRRVLLPIASELTARER